MECKYCGANGQIHQQKPGQCWLSVLKTLVSFAPEVVFHQYQRIWSGVTSYGSIYNTEHGVTSHGIIYITEHGVTSYGSIYITEHGVTSHGC
jgi:hypothetical protein